MNIIARLGLDTAGFKSGLKDARSALGGFASKLAGAFGISISVGAVTGAVEKILAYGKRIDDLSQRYQVNAGALQRLGNAAELNGSSLDGVAQGFNKLEISQSRALGGNQHMIKAFAALGVSVDDLRKLSPEEIMAKLGKSSMNAADMVAVLGKAALSLRPTLEGVANGTIKLGKAIDEVDVKKLAEAHDFFRKMGQNVTINAASGLSGLMNYAKPELYRQAFEEQKSAAKSFFEAIVAGARGSFAEAKKHLLDFKNAALGLSETLEGGKMHTEAAGKKKPTSRSEFDQRQERLNQIEGSGVLDFKLKEIADSAEDIFK